nr:hypothetical protein [Pyrinomonadaceae bacterium]
ESITNLPLGQFYAVTADNRQPFYNVMGGLQDNGTWVGPSRTREPAGIQNDDWRMISFGDGFWVLNQADDPDLYISESQGGGVVRTDMRTREQQSIAPDARDSDGPATEQKFRFNWNAPVIPSPHDKNTIYLGGNVVFRSTDFGRTWAAISPDLTTNDKAKQGGAGGPVAFENTGAEYHTTVISLAESPLRAGVIYAGTDDGNLQMTSDGGKNWTNLTRNVAGLPANSPVSHVEPSRADANLVYASFDRHQLDDLRPYIYKSTDDGRTWRNIAGNLPEKAYVWIVREDPRSANLIYAGTELGLFASFNGGANWIPLNMKNLPNVAVHDIIVHPRDNDLIIGTHGRSILIFDDATALQQMNPSVLNSETYLFEPRAGLRYTQRFTRYGIGDKVFTGQNPPYGALITYYLKNKLDPKTTVKLQIYDANNKLVSESANVPKEAGLNRAVWDLRYGGPRVRRPPTDEEVQFTGGPRGPQVLPGTYTVKLTVGNQTQERKVEVRIDPTISVTTDALQLMQDMTLKLRDMQSATNDALRALDSIKSQLQFIERTVKDRSTEPPKELLETIATYTKQIEALQGRLARPDGGLGFEGRAQLVDRIGGLFFAIDGTNAAPTGAQRQYFNELQGEYQTRISEVNKFINETVPKLNEALRRGGAPNVLPGKPVAENP